MPFNIGKPIKSMNSLNKSSLPENSGQEADVSLLLYKSGKALKQFILWIAALFAGLGKAVLAGLLFLLRNILWLAIGAAIGIAYAAYIVKRDGKHYVADMTVKANFNSTRSLYNTIDLFNQLIGTGRTDELADLFKISNQEAKQLVAFSISSIESELITAELYKQQFLQNDRTVKIRQDTFWMRTIKYPDFKESLTKLDYPYQQITVTSTDPTLFPKLQKGIIDYVSRNELLQELRNKQVISNRDEEKLIISAIENIDTLRRAYNQRLLRGQDPSLSGGNQLMVMESTPNIKTPELDLYDKMLELQDELKSSRKRNSTEHDILEVFTPFNTIGKRLRFFDQAGTEYALTGLAISFLILLSLSIYRSVSSGKKIRLKSNDNIS